ncbi:MAG: hypothetical protein R3F54_22065 [Alphaproteobacteria bacterium]
MQRVVTTGRLEPQRAGGRKPLPLDRHAEALAGMVAADHDMTQVEIQAELKRRFDGVAGLSTIHRMLRRLGLRLRKSRREPPDRTAPTPP